MTKTEVVSDDTHVEETEDDTVIGRALAWSIAVLVIVGVLAGAAYGVSVWLTPEKVDVVVEAVDPGKRKFGELELPRIPLTPVTNEAGVTFEMETGAAGEKLLPGTMGGGVAAFDYDGDGDADLLLVGGSTWDAGEDAPSSLALYRNDGNFTFTDVTAEAGLDVAIYGMGPAVGDFDGDGDLDLYIAALGPNRLFRNDGGRFVDVTEATGTAGGDDDWASSAGWLDYDRDGDQDLMVLNYVTWSREFDLQQDFNLTGTGRSYGRPTNFAGSQPLLFRNDGGAFTDVAEEAGLFVTNPATGAPACKSLGLAVHDFDGDGWTDLFIANDTVANCMFRNRHDGTFEEIGVVAGVAYDDMGNARGAMGVDASYFRGDETLGLAIGNFANEMTALYVDPEGSLSFTDEAVVTGLGPQTRLLLTFGVVWTDADLDGRPDLFCANGHLDEEISVVQPSQTYEQPPLLFWNAGAESGTELIPLTAEQTGEAFFEPLVGRGAATADFDLDGDEDLVIANLEGLPRVVRNDQATGHHWLRVTLSPPAAANNAIVTLTAGDRTQRRVVTPTRSYLSQCEMPLTFGLGEADSVDSLTVTWPDGTEQEVAVAEVDRAIVVEKAAQ